MIADDAQPPKTQPQIGPAPQPNEHTYAAIPRRLVTDQ